jgi:hypothetical protein
MYPMPSIQTLPKGLAHAGVAGGRFPCGMVLAHRLVGRLLHRHAVQHERVVREGGLSPL